MTKKDYPERLPIPQLNHFCFYAHPFLTFSDTFQNPISKSNETFSISMEDFTNDEATDFQIEFEVNWQFGGENIANNNHVNMRWLVNRDAKQV